MDVVSIHGRGSGWVALAWKQLDGPRHAVEHAKMTPKAEQVTRKRGPEFAMHCLRRLSSNMPSGSDASESKLQATPQFQGQSEAGLSEEATATDTAETG